MPTESCNEITNRPRYFNPFFMNKKKLEGGGKEGNSMRNKIKKQQCYFFKFSNEEEDVLKIFWKSAILRAHAHLNLLNVRKQKNTTNRQTNLIFFLKKGSFDNL